MSLSMSSRILLFRFGFSLQKQNSLVLSLVLFTRQNATVRRTGPTSQCSESGPTSCCGHQLVCSFWSHQLWWWIWSHQLVCWIWAPLVCVADLTRQLVSVWPYQSVTLVSVPLIETRLHTHGRRDAIRSLVCSLLPPLRGRRLKTQLVKENSRESYAPEKAVLRNTVENFFSRFSLELFVDVVYTRGHVGLVLSQTKHTCEEQVIFKQTTELQQPAFPRHKNGKSFAQPWLPMETVRDQGSTNVRARLAEDTHGRKGED